MTTVADVTNGTSGAAVPQTPDAPAVRLPAIQIDEAQIHAHLDDVVRQTVERYSPERVSGDVADGLKRLGADLRAAVSEGRLAMREREAELRSELETRQAVP